MNNFFPRLWDLIATCWHAMVGLFFYNPLACIFLILLFLLFIYMAIAGSITAGKVIKNAGNVPLGDEYWAGGLPDSSSDGGAS